MVPGPSLSLAANYSTPCHLYDDVVGPIRPMLVLNILHVRGRAPRKNSSVGLRNCCETRGRHGLKHQQGSTMIVLAHQFSRALSQWKDMDGKVQGVRSKMGSWFGSTGRRVTKFIRGVTG